MRAIKFALTIVFAVAGLVLLADQKPAAMGRKARLLSGTVQGGVAAVTGASVTLYAAGTAYGSNATTLGSATADSNGNFTVKYTPPAPPAVLYVLALGGNAGSGSNAAIGLMGVAGRSNALPASVTINELTTVAAEWALAKFTDATGQILGAPSSNATGFANAVNQMQGNLADISTGAAASFWASYGANEANCTGGSPPVNCDGLERMDTLSNILAACVESSGPSSSACSTLLSETGGGSTTLQAAHFMATNLTASITDLFVLQSGSPPFIPDLSAAPGHWVIGLNFVPSGASFHEPVGVAIDAGGNVWAANYLGDSVTELSSSGGLAGNFAPSGANFNGPGFLAIDAGGNVWVTNPGNPRGSGNSVTELTSGGGLVGNFAPSGANFQDPLGVAIDAGGNVWVASNGGNSVTELSSSGGLVANFAPIGPNFGGPHQVAIDAGDKAWVTNFFGDSVTELSSSGGLVGNFAPSGANFNRPYQVAIDSGGNVWVANNGGNSVTELNSSGGLVGNFAPSGANFKNPVGVATDAGGNVWVANAGGDSVSELVGLAKPVLTPLVACLKQSPPHAVCLP